MPHISYPVVDPYGAEVQRDCTIWHPCRGGPLPVNMGGRGAPGSTRPFSIGFGHTILSRGVQSAGGTEHAHTAGARQNATAPAAPETAVAEVGAIHDDAPILRATRGGGGVGPRRSGTILEDPASAGPAGARSESSGTASAPAAGLLLSSDARLLVEPQVTRPGCRRVRATSSRAAARMDRQARAADRGSTRRTGKTHPRRRRRGADLPTRGRVSSTKKSTCRLAPRRRDSVRWGAVQQ